MPTKPARPCRMAGCRNRCEDGKQYCPEHQLVVERARRKRLEGDECAEFYQTREWRMLRKEVLTAEPLCRICREHGRLTPATIVDHIMPIRQGGDKMDRSNLQPLCARCHERKSIEEGSRFWAGGRGGM